MAMLAPLLFPLAATATTAPPAPLSELDLIPSFALSSGSSQLKSPWHPVCEDLVVDNVQITPTMALFGVVDGHGGVACAKFISQALPFAVQRLSGSLSSSSLSGKYDTEGMEAWASILERAFDSSARAWDELNCLKAGAVAAFVLADLETGRMIVAHVGDCKVVTSSSSAEGGCIELTRDHRCTDPEESQRIEQLGARVVGGRLHGLLPSRSFGDVNVRLHASRKASTLEAKSQIFQQCIKPSPDLCFFSLAPSRSSTSTDFVLIASDGLFDVVSPQLAVDHVRRSLGLGHSPSRAAQSLIELAAPSANDDVSVLILHHK
ncbi:hypothetical protein BASA81_009138 [Batrachochytrium salamandrivorans]|nr:hypothetical protein BASA81_009138 [Batrachochytrium salamandrivorans]